MIALNWRTLPDASGPRSLVKGTELARAKVPDTCSRFYIYEVRALELAPPGSLDRYVLTVRYGVRDAGAISDADVRAGKRPPYVSWHDEPDAAVAWCLEQA